MDMLEILFRHQDFVAINKPGGISVHQDSGETGLARTLAIQLGVERVWLLHRLDKQTSGILLFALNKESASALSGQFAGKSIKKPIWHCPTASRPKSRVGLKAEWKNPDVECGS